MLTGYGPAGRFGGQIRGLYDDGRITDGEPVTFVRPAVPALGVPRSELATEPATRIVVLQRLPRA